MSNVPSSVNVPKNPAERRVWILGQLRLRGLSLRKLARREGVTVQAMSHALAGASSYLQDVLAAELGLTAPALFPEFFTAAGERLTWTREKQRSTRRQGRNDQQEQAA